MSTLEVKTPWYIPEILRYIRIYTNLSDFAALCQTSKGIHNVGRELLYESIYLELSNRHLDSLSLLYRTLEENPTLASQVKKLYFQLCDSKTSSRDDDLRSHHASQSPTLSKILDLCPNLTTISITHPYPVSDPVTQKINRSISNALHLQELKFITIDTMWPPHIPGETDVNISLLTHALRVKSLSSISMTLQQGPDSLILPASLVMPPVNSIVRLSLKNAYLSMESLSGIMSQLIHLKHLSLSFLWYADPVNPHVGEHLDCDKLGLALAHRASALQSLKIAVRFESRCALEVTGGGGPHSNWGPRHSIGSLESFTKLQSLQLAPEILLGWEKDVNVSLRDLLPVSLRDLHFRWDFGAWEKSPWEFEALCELLATNLDSTNPLPLRDLVLTCFDDEVSRFQKSFELIESRSAVLISALRLVCAVVIQSLVVFPSKTAMPPTPHTPAAVTQSVVTDLTICVFSPNDPPSTCELDPRIWHRIEKDLFLYTSEKSAWLYVALANEEGLTAEDLLVTDIRVGEPRPNSSSGDSWESRPYGIWVLRSKFAGNIDQAVTEVDVLFGIDAVDPRPQWTLMRSPLQLNAPPNIPIARLSILHGRSTPRSDVRPALRVRKDGKFKIVQISDTHMVTGVGVCRDAIDADGKDLPESEADPLTVEFMGRILDVERPDLVVLTGDQLHHDIPDSQSALFKVVAPIIERRIPFAAVFGNHDSEGVHALSRTAQMSILQNLPFNLSEPGPSQVDGTGNFYLQVLAPFPSEDPLINIIFPRFAQPNPKQNPQPRLRPYHAKPNRLVHADFSNISESHKTLRKARHNDKDNFHLSLTFLHIPLPEFANPNLRICKGRRREPTEGPSVNSHFYDVLVKEDVVALGCGHDHVNDFCGLLPREDEGMETKKRGPWLCYGGGTGFGGMECMVGSGGRVWELDTGMGRGVLRTWLRVEYGKERVDEVVLVEGGEVMSG
ncbi:Phosphatase DCR2 protein [Rutstroemia sp. NJR-2017a WRK4]|nr:Phosphatase DCR2 protein [Rutstroemia sp. NJR-2017a WRK4]